MKGTNAQALPPEPFAGCFARRGRSPHDRQIAILEGNRVGAHTLLIAPTGGGKTLAGFRQSFLDSAIRGLFGSDLRVLLIGRDRIHRIAEERLRP